MVFPRGSEVAYVPGKLYTWNERFNMRDKSLKKLLIFYRSVLVFRYVVTPTYITMFHGTLNRLFNEGIVCMNAWNIVVIFHIYFRYISVLLVVQKCNISTIEKSYRMSELSG